MTILVPEILALRRGPYPDRPWSFRDFRVLRDYIFSLFDNIAPDSEFCIEPCIHFHDLLRPQRTARPNQIQVSPSAQPSPNPTAPNLPAHIESQPNSISGEVKPNSTRSKASPYPSEHHPSPYPTYSSRLQKKTSQCRRKSL